MGFGMFSGQQSPIAIDFGSSSIKMLQVNPGSRPELVSAVELPIPDNCREEPRLLMDFLHRELPKAVAGARFKGKRAVAVIPSAQSLIQHMQLMVPDGAKIEDLAKTELQVTRGYAPDRVVVRTIDVADVHRGGQHRREVICLAIARDLVMRYISLLKKCKLDVVGVHTEVMSMVRAFDHVNRRDEDANIVTLYADLGWSGTKVAITHGQQIVFARHIAIGGRSFDEHIAATLHCDAATARGHRLALEGGEQVAATSPGRGSTTPEGMAILGSALQQGSSDATESQPQPEAAAVATERRTGGEPMEYQRQLLPGSPSSELANVDQSELLDTITDELNMCLRYHRGLFADRTIDRVIFVGGEARQSWLCQHLVRELRLPARLGDPLARLATSSGGRQPGVDLTKPQPGWAVPFGLCSAPTDL